ncbi:hypothetical protein Tco_0348689 [Tanacetum coccineum]
MVLSLTLKLVPLCISNLQDQTPEERTNQPDETDKQQTLDEDIQEEILQVIQEFGVVVMGHEFDSYPKKMIRDIKRQKKGKRRKRKKGAANDDEDDHVWTGESEEDAELIKKLKNDNKPKYSTRSKDQKKSKKGASTSKSGKHTTKSYAMDVDVEDDDEDENDETLGGFIVDDEDLGEAIDEDMDEEFDKDDEEEEFE